jgi:hypothetical protein
MNRSVKKMVILGCFAATVAAQQTYLVDNCDDGDARSMRGGWWYTYNDREKGGNSHVLPPPGGFKMSGTGYGDKGFAAHMKGTAGDRLGWDFIGMGVNITDSCGCPDAKPVDMSGFSKIRFRMKGSVSGGRLVLVLTYTENRCKKGADSPESLTEWADYEAPLTSKVEPDWVTVELDLGRDFHQPKWTKRTALVPIGKVLENLKNLNFHYSSPDGDTIDLWVDDVEFVK